MKRTSFARSPFSMNGRYRLQIVSFGAQQLLCEKELVMRVNQTTTITTTCSSGADLDCKLYDNAGFQIGRSTLTGQVSMTIKLVAGQKYYFDIYNYSKTVTEYTFSISQEG